MAAGCASAVPVEGPVRLGQTAFVDGPKVRADRIVEDSRCPVDTECVWAGRMILRTTVFGGGWSRQVDLELGKAVQVADGTLELVSATPPQRSGGGGRGSAYRFTFRFRGGR
jgi:hypothetical protein